MDFYNISKQKAMEHFQVSFNGLTDQQVLKNRKQYGKNVLAEKTVKTKAQVFFEQFKDLLVIILIIAAFISLLTGELESTIVIFFVIILNAFLGTIQHFKAEKSLNSLKALSSPAVRVIRHGEEIVIPTSEVVVGDIIEIKAGDIISADGRIVYCLSLEVNESALTGESQSVEKTDVTLNESNIPIADQHNMVFSGSTVTAGKGLLVATKVGMETELGKIAKMLESSKNHKTPLQESLDDFSKKLAILIIAICIIVFALSLYRHVMLLDALLFSVALAVAAIPEALSSIVTIVLAIGTQKMAEEHAIIKELKAVEGLGCVNVICSDKTGTITMNRMDVRQLYINQKMLMANELRNDASSKLFIFCCLLCNDSVLTGFQSSNFTEVALIDFLKTIGIEVYGEVQKYPRLKEIAFDSKRKMMSTLHSINEETFLFSKGGSDVIIDKCDYIYTGSFVRRMTEGDRNDINITIRNFTSSGYRTLGFAYKKMSDSELSESDETEMVFLGLVALFDPPRAEAKQAISDCFSAGIRPVMITGDHPNTALAIAKEVGIFRPKDIIMTGMEMDSLTDRDLSDTVATICVFARVSPEHKIRIVKAWQQKQGIVAFVGDGINDAPAIRQANIGISMGKSGTEVAKDASSIILTDDNYFTIVKAVKNGRKIYNNIQNAITFLLSGNAAGILLVLFTSLLKLPLPFAPVHLLFINLLTDSLPAIAIGMEESEEDLLAKPPRNPKQSLLSSRVVKIIIFEGILLAGFTILSYFSGLQTSMYAARTCVFGTLCMARLFHSFNCRGTKSILLNKVKNQAMIFSFIGGMILINLVLYQPWLMKVFHTFPLNLRQTILMYAASLLPTLILQLILLFRYLKRRRKVK